MKPAVVASSTTDAYTQVNVMGYVPRYITKDKPLEFKTLMEYKPYEKALLGLQSAKKCKIVFHKSTGIKDDSPEKAQAEKVLEEAGEQLRLVKKGQRHLQKALKKDPDSKDLKADFEKSVSAVNDAQQKMKKAKENPLVA